MMAGSVLGDHEQVQCSGAAAGVVLVEQVERMMEVLAMVGELCIGSSGVDQLGGSWSNCGVRRKHGK